MKITAGHQIKHNAGMSSVGATVAKGVSVSIKFSLICILELAT